MLRDTSRNGKSKKVRMPRVKYYRISADAADLGVSRGHLWMVLTGTRQSARLLARYRALKIQQLKELEAS